MPRTADVVIVGAGIIGLCSALSLVRRGAKNIVIVERGGICGESTGASAGGIWLAHECFSGRVGAMHAARSRELFAQLDEQFDLDFAKGGLLEPDDSATEVEARKQIEVTRSAGFQAEWISGSEIQELEPNLDYHGGAYFFPGDGSIHPAKLAASVVRYLRDCGVCVCLDCEVSSIETGRLETSAGAISARTIVVTAGAWTPLITRLLGWEPPIRPIRGTLISYPVQAPRTLRSVVLGRHFYYWQLACGPIAGGGSEHDIGFERGVDDAVVKAIHSDFQSLFPDLATLAVECTWSGFRPRCEDQNPVIGAVPGHDRVYVAAGHFRSGIQLGPLTGELLAEEIVSGKVDSGATAFRPERFRPISEGYSAPESTAR